MTHCNCGCYVLESGKGASHNSGHMGKTLLYAHYQMAMVALTTVQDAVCVHEISKLSMESGEMKHPRRFVKESQGTIGYILLAHSLCSYINVV